MSENPSQPTPEPPQNQPAQPNPPQSTPPQPAPEKKNNGETLQKLNSLPFIWPAAIALAVLFYLGLVLLNDTLTHESTDDAFIAGHVVSIAPRIDGQVSAVHILDNQMVRSNDLLVEIDPSDYAITVAQKQSAAEAQDANVKTILAADELMRKKVATAEASARKAQADADANAASAKLAAMNFERAESLLKDKTISQQEFDAAQAANNSAQANLISAQQNVAEENSKVDESHSQLAAAEAEVGLARAQWEESQTNVASAQLNLSYTKIFAPCDGRVTRKQVEAGDYLQTGQTIMSIVPVEVWVAANFKESQLRKMKPGQSTFVKIDALGGRKFRAHVDSVQAGSGAAFSLLPPENATGNFVKVIQRVPVKIIFDEPLPADHTIGPGLSVTPSVQTSSFRVPDFVTAIVAIILAFTAAFVFRFILNRKTNGDGK
jgi:membrane fusion protein (multidrug efflux system)